MQLLSFFSGLFFVGVLFNLLPYDWPEYVSVIVGGLGFFIAFGGFIVSVSFLAPMLFEEKLAAMKKYLYVALSAYTVCLAIDVLLRQEVYGLAGSTFIQYIVLGITSATVLFCLARIRLFATEQKIDLSQLNWQFLKLGASLEDTRLYKSIGWLDRYFIGFAVVSVLIESEFILLGITALILVLASKDVRMVYREFKGSFIGKRKAFWTVVLFYGSYLLAITVAFTLDKDVLTLFVASLSMLLIKVYYHEIVKETLRSAG